MAKTYEQRLKSHINTCFNTVQVYVLQGVPSIAGEFAKAAASSAFKLNPELRIPTEYTVHDEVAELHESGMSWSEALAFCNID